MSPASRESSAAAWEASAAGQVFGRPPKPPGAPISIGLTWSPPTLDPLGEPLSTKYISIRLPTFEASAALTIVPPTTAVVPEMFTQVICATIWPMPYTSVPLPFVADTLKLRSDPHDNAEIAWLCLSRWSQPGSNRRPPRCQRGALPAELWPLG